MGGGATVTVLTLYNAIHESRKKKAKGMTRFPNQFPGRDGHPCYYRYHRLEYDFLSFSPPLLFSFLLMALSLPLFPFPSRPSLYRYLPLLRVASSVQQLSVVLELQ